MQAIYANNLSVLEEVGYGYDLVFSQTSRSAALTLEFVLNESGSHIDPSRILSSRLSSKISLEAVLIHLSAINKFHPLLNVVSFSSLVTSYFLSRSTHSPKQI